MAVRDPPYRDAFSVRAHPATVFGPSELVPGGYVVYRDGKLRDLTNLSATTLNAHDLVWVKDNIDSWSEPVGFQDPMPAEAYDAALAQDPSVRPPPLARRHHFY